MESMDFYAEIAKYVDELTRLTQKGKLLWKNVILTAHETECAGRKIYVEFLQDDKPEIYIDDARIQGYGLGIEELVRAIYDQYARKELYEYHNDPSDTSLKNRGQDQAKLFCAAAESMLIDFGKRRKRKGK